MAEDQPDLFTYEPPPQDPALPPMRHGPGKAVHPEVRRQREAYIEAALERGETLVQIARAAGVAVDTENVGATKHIFRRNLKTGSIKSVNACLAWKCSGQKAHTTECVRIAD